MTAKNYDRGTSIYLDELVYANSDDDRWHFDRDCEFALDRLEIIERAHAERLWKDPCPVCASVYELPDEEYRPGQC